MATEAGTPQPAEHGAAAPRRMIYRSRGLELSYLEWGDPAAPVLVLVHGGLENAHAWGPVAQRLAGRWRIIAPDLRGHGDSQWACGADYGVLDFMSDLAVLFAHHELAPAILAGHSLGGAVATHFAALYPEKVVKLCVIEGLRPVGQRSPGHVDETLAAIRAWADKAASGNPLASRIYPDTEPMIARLRAADPLLPEDLARTLALSNIRAREQGYSWKYDPRVRETALTSTIGPEPHHFWERIACPTLLVYGEQSWATSPAMDGRLEYFRHARVAEVQDAGHNLHHHQPGAFCAVLEEFLAE